MTSLSFKDIEPSDWLTAIPGYNVVVIREMLAAGHSFVAVAEIWISQTGPDQNQPHGSSPPNQQKFFERAKSEFSKFVCGDPSYSELRQQASKTWTGQKTAIVSSISAVIAANIGVTLALLVPVIALLLATVSQIGIEAWCAG